MSGDYGMKTSIETEMKKVLDNLTRLHPGLNRDAAKLIFISGMSSGIKLVSTEYAKGMDFETLAKMIAVSNDASNALKDLILAATVNTGAVMTAIDFLRRRPDRRAILVTVIINRSVIT